EAEREEQKGNRRVARNLVLRRIAETGELLAELGFDAEGILQRLEARVHVLLRAARGIETRFRRLARKTRRREIVADLLDVRHWQVAPHRPSAFRRRAPRRVPGPGTGRRRRPRRSWSDPTR